MGRVFLGLLFLAAIGSLMSCVTLVSSDERAVVRRFGRILPEKPGPGLFLGLPWGMDRVNRVSVKDQSITVGWTDKDIDDTGVALTPGQMLTGDHNLVNVRGVIEYRVIGDQADRYVLMEDRVKPLLARAAEAAMAQWLAGHEVDHALLEGKKRLEIFLTERVDQWIVPYELGVQVDRVSIILIVPPGEVREFFNAVSESHTRMETQKNKALEDKDKILSKAKEEVYRIERDTAAYVREQELAARADAESFLVRLDQYRRLRQDNPQHINNLWLDEVTRMYAQLKRSGRLDVLDHYIGSDGLNITQFPLQKKK
jgi:modulator of FtsH protease HflK